MSNTRYIDIDLDTRVGYSYIKAKYYVTNKGYTTYRPTISEIQKVLNALDINNIEDSQLEALSSEEETLHSLYYTWDETGSYIRTIQFNDFKEYPLTIDLSKKKIYIMNSNVVYDLEINESVKNVRVPYIQSYYITKLGLYLNENDIKNLYNLLVSFYSPTVYNQIATPDDLEKDLTKLSYTNIFKLSNYNETSPIVYYGTYNALDKEVPSRVGYVESVNANTQCITSVVATDEIFTGDKVIIEGAEELNNIYSADGAYTVAKVEGTNIYVEETIPTSYVFPHEVCSLITVEAGIREISRDTQTITLDHSVPNTIFVGDKIHVKGTTVTTNYETITCNGVYTVQRIEGSSITVEESIPTNYTGNAGSIYKEIKLGNVKRVENSKIYLTENLTLTISQNAHVTIYDPTTNTTSTYTVQSTGLNYIQVTGTIEGYTPNYPELQKAFPSTETMITVSKSNYDYFPTGEFLLDTFEQAQEYIKTIAHLPYPETVIRDNLYGNVAKQYSIEETSTGVSSMTLLGLYPKVYTDKDK